MAFDDETTDVLIGGYLSKDAAMEDYESVLGCGGYLHGAVVVTKDLKGELEVQQTDHMVREGAAGLGAVGFVVGVDEDVHAGVHAPLRGLLDLVHPR